MIQIKFFLKLAKSNKREDIYDAKAQIMEIQAALDIKRDKQGHLPTVEDRVTYSQCIDMQREYDKALKRIDKIEAQKAANRALKAAYRGKAEAKTEIQVMKAGIQTAFSLARNDIRQKHYKQIEKDERLDDSYRAHEFRNNPQFQEALKQFPSKSEQHIEEVINSYKNAPRPILDIDPSSIHHEQTVAMFPVPIDTPIQAINTVVESKDQIITGNVKISDVMNALKRKDY